jgi:hypothetical protein
MTLDTDFHFQQGAFVFTKQLFHTLECNRVDVPCVTLKILHAVHAAIVRRMKAVVHR